MPPHRPAFEDFAHRAGDARFVPVYRQLVGDALTPVSAFRRIERPGPSFLFESVVGGEKVGRFSFLGTEPFLRFEARGNRVTITPTADSGSARTFKSADPFRDLEALLSEYRAIGLPELPRFTGGAVGFAAYDSVRYIERLPNPPPDDRGLPDLSFALYDRMVLFDHIRKTVLVVAHAHLGPGVDPRMAYDDACRRIDQLVDRLATPGPEPTLPDIDTSVPATFTPESNMTQAQFEAASSAAAQEYIKAGDIFQVVLSQRFTRSRPRPQARSTSTGCAPRGQLRARSSST